MPLTVFGRWAGPSVLSPKISTTPSKTPVGKAPLTQVGTKSVSAAAKATLTAASAPKVTTSLVNKVPATVSATAPSISQLQKPVVQQTSTAASATSGKTATLPSSHSASPMSPSVTAQKKEETKPTVNTTSIVANLLQTASGVSAKPGGEQKVVVKDGAHLIPTYTQAPSTSTVMDMINTANKPVQTYQPTPKPLDANQIATMKPYPSHSTAPASVLAAESATTMFQEQVSQMGTGVGPSFGVNSAYNTKPSLPSVAQPGAAVKPHPTTATIPSVPGAASATAVLAPSVTAGSGSSGSSGPMPATGPAPSAGAAAVASAAASPAPKSGKSTALVVGVGVAVAILFAFSRGSR